MAATLKTIRDRLLAERERVTDEIAAALETQRAFVEEAGLGTHPGDNGTETFDKELSVSLQTDLQALLGQIDHALHKAEQGTYGICDDCGQAIPRERLEALPHAALCLRCRQRAERNVRVAHYLMAKV
ncbi:MAG: TraR/DksA C4-type zinc finger protein [Chloroflexota bacterium]|nr:TraR/DksA C4-type zinc finger protein [Chloroflexota bacterium]